MRNKQQILSRAAIRKRPPKQEISGTEFRRRQKKINEWRKQRLAELRCHTLDSAE